MFARGYTEAIACPEYNSSITQLLKNALDWALRPEPGEPTLVCFKEKVAVLMSASPGGLGGLRGLVHVRSILSNIGLLVLQTKKQLETPIGRLMRMAICTIRHNRQQSCS